MKRIILKYRNSCRGCDGKNLTNFLNLGNMPLAGGFLTKRQIRSEIKIPLSVYFCNTCGLVQILEVIDPKILFKKYCYISSVIPSLSLHFKDYSMFLKKTYLNKKRPVLVEFGCNDGVLLQYFKNDKKIKAVGVDPSVNVTKLARKKGVNVITTYFDTKSALRLKRKFGKVDVITGSNVFAHTDDIHEILRAAKILMKPNGVFIVEVHYLGNLLNEFQYDSIYHEHLSYYSLIALQNIFKLQHLRIIDCQHLPMHGGAIRVIACSENSSLESLPIVSKFIRKEKQQKFDRVQPFINFGKKIIMHKNKLIQLLNSLKKRGKSIIGYGASGRGTMLLNYCHIICLDYIVDVSPLRVGKLMPGVHTPIYPIQKSRDNPPDYFLVLAWNYISSILKQENILRKKGVKFIIPFPKIKII